MSQGKAMPDRIAPIASTVTYAASGGSTLFGVFTTNEIAAIGGLILATGTFIINLVYRHKLYQLELIKTEHIKTQRNVEEDHH